MSSTNDTPNLADLLGGAPEPSDTSKDVVASSEVTESSPSGASTPDLTDLLGTENLDVLTPSDTPSDKVSGDSDAPSLDDLLGTGEKKAEPEIVHFSDLSPTKEVGVPGEEDKNMFQKTFADQGEEREEHIIDAIENYDGEFELTGVGEERREDPFLLMRKKEEKAFSVEEKKWKQFLIISQSFSVFALLFSVASFFIFSFLLDTPTKGVLGDFVSYNYGIEQEEKTDQLETLTAEITALDSEIKKLKASIQGLENNELLDSIITDRINWKKALSAIKTVRQQSQSTEESQSVFFENYNTKGDLENGKVVILITGKAYSYKNVFQKISSLVDAFNESEYFNGAQIRRFNKTDDGRQYYMPFSLELEYYPKGRFADEIDRSEK